MFTLCLVLAGCFLFEDPGSTECEPVAVYEDDDGDGVGGREDGEACEVAFGQAAVGGDCDDDDPEVTEVVFWHPDLDGDGHGAAGSTPGGCEPPAGVVAGGDDCDDGAASVFPGAAETCDGLDNDCDGLTDAADADLDQLSVWYRDADDDGFGDAAFAVEDCSAPSGYVPDATDCDDLDDGVNPDAAEVCADGVDNNCDGGAPECDLDGEHTAADAAVITVYGNEADSNFGRSRAGDLDGDGIDDLVVSDPARSLTADHAGAAFIYYGPLSGSYEDDEADAVVVGGPLWGIWAPARPDWDFDGDGLNDLVGNSYGVDLISGYMDYQGVVAVLFSPQVDGRSAEDADFLAEGTTDNEFMGLTVTGADYNGDGQTDLLIGNGGADATLLYYGPLPLGTVTADDADVRFADPYSADEFVGADFDGDGYDELVFGGAYNPAEGTDAGRVYIAPSGSRYDLTLADDADHHTVGAHAYDHLGEAVSVGDLDGDGRPDLAVGASGADGGCVYVFVAPFATKLDIGNADGRRCDRAATSFHGQRLVVLGDLSGDGVAELALGAPWEDDPAADAGAVYLLYGPVAGTGYTDEAEALLLGGTGGDLFGFDVDAGGDVNDDGTPDLHVSAIGSSARADGSGVGYVISGGGL